MANKKKGKRARAERLVIPLSSGAELWKALSVEQARDRELETQLKSSFGCPATRSLSTWFSTHGTSAQDLLVELLEVGGPYVLMWQEILAMFELAQARLTRRNLAISFEFSRMSELKMDLSHFKAQIRAASQALEVRGLESWKSADYWDLCRLLKRAVATKTERANQSSDWVKGYYVGDVAVDRWIDEYLRERRFPKALPALPRSHSLELQQALTTARWLLVAALNECRRYGVLREKLGGLDHQLPSLGRIPSRQLAYTDSDHTFAALLRALWRCREAFESPERRSESSAFAGELRAFLRNRGISFEPAELAKQVADLLSLPQWKHRHELYAVWLASQVVHEAGPQSAVFHVVDDCLPFSFKASRLAILNYFKPPLDVWLEVRSPLSKPKGKGRKKNVQPDMAMYRGLRTQATDAPICVVEAKHYAKSSSSFIDVLDDYSRAHARADIALVNYGPAAEYKAGGGSGSRAVKAIGECYPSGRGSDELTLFLRACLSRHYGPDEVGALESKGALSAANPVGVSLKWSGGNCDLDLHVIVERGAERQHVYYGSMTSGTGSVALSKDCRSSPGEEPVRLSLKSDEVYHFYVHAYDGDAASFRFSAVNAMLDVQQGRPFFSEFIFAPDGPGLYWHVLTVDGASGRWILINSVGDTSRIGALS